MSRAMPRPWLWWRQKRHTKRQRCKPVALHHFCMQLQKSCVFSYRLFHLKTPSGLRLTFDAAERMQVLTAFNAKEVKSVAADEREREKYSSAERQCEVM